MSRGNFEWPATSVIDRVVPRGVVPVSRCAVTWMNGGVRQPPLRHPSYTHVMATRLVVPLALVALVGSACSGGGDAADTTPPTSITPTTVATTTTTTTAITTSTTITSTTTTVPATTAPTAPPSTPAPTAPEVTASTRPLPVPDGFTLEEVQVIDRDFREGFRRYYEALADPTNDALVQAALDYTIGFETGDFAETINVFRTNNRRVERLPAPPQSFEILQGPTRLQNPDEVRLLLCHVVPFISYDIADNGTRTLLNEGVITQEVSVDLRLDAGVWKRVAQIIEGQWDGVVRCQDMS